MRTSVLTLLVAAVLLSLTDGQFLKQQSCMRSSGHRAIIQPDADAFIAGFFGMHRSSPTGGCGDIYGGEMQYYEAIRWALDRLNKKDENLNGEDLTDYYIPGVKIGMVANDYCFNADIAVSQAVELFPQFAAQERECSMSDELMLGMIGASSSDDTKEMEKFGEAYNIPIVSFQSMAPELSDYSMFPNFLRTVPPDGPLTDTIVKLSGRFDWDYVVVVFTDNSYGRGAYREIRPQLATAGICLTSAIAVDPKDNSDATMDGVFREVMDTNTTGVIYLGSNFIVDALFKRGEGYDGAGKLQWIVTDSITLSEKFPGQVYPRGVISVVPAGRKIIEFEDHWVRIDVNNPSAENPWYKGIYMAKNQCFLPGVTNSPFTTPCDAKTETQRRNEYVQDQYVESAVHAVFTYARALKHAQAALCSGPGMCPALKALTTLKFYENYMRSLDFVYGKAERVESLASVSLDPYNAAARLAFMGNDIINQDFEIWNFNDYPFGTSWKFTDVGSNIDNLLEIINARLRFYDEPRTSVLGAIPPSSCPTDPCSPCLGAIMDPKYVYIPGDVVITSVFGVHTHNPMSMMCADFINTPDQGIQFMQAFIFAVNFVNNQFAQNRGILNGVSLGALGFDDCMNPVLLNQQITEVMRYSRKIVDQNGDNMLDPRTIEAFMGGKDPYDAIAMAKLMNTLKRPMIGTRTYSGIFNDDDMFPYFVRANYDLRYLSQAIVNIAKRNGWMFIQTVHHHGMFGVEMNTVLREVAAKEGICVVASYELESMEAAEVVMKLKERADVQPVVLLLNHNGFRDFMSGIVAHNASEDFQLISMIGNSKRSVEDYEDYVSGMISVKLWSPSDNVNNALTDFQTAMAGIDAATYMTNPWMMEWYENYYDCSFMPMAGETQCGTQNMFNDFDFEFNTDTITVVYGVIAIATGLHNTLEHYCGLGYNGLCGNFRNAADKGNVLMEMMLATTQYLEDGNAYEFKFEKNGNLPFNYFNFRGNSRSFNNIGSYKPAEDFLYFDTYTLTAGRLPSQVQSSCPGVCMECLYLFRYQKYMYIPGDILIPGIFDVHYNGDSPYSCADIRKNNGFQYTEAFRYALTQVNDRKSGQVQLNPGVTLGGLGFDGCTDSIRASALVTGVYSAAFPKAGTDLDTIDLDVQKLKGWLTYDSQSTINVATILQRFGIPSVSPGATSPVLDDKDKFTTFFRTIPSDTRVAEAMAKLSNELGFEYVLTLNAPEDGSRDAVKMFRKYAFDHGICVGASYEFETDGDAAQIMDYILQSSTKVVAVFASPDKFIQELLEEKGRRVDADNLVFIANQPWSTVPAVQSDPEVVSRSINFMMDGNVDLLNFRLWLRNQRPTADHPNPWFREYYETVKQCNFAGTYKYSTSCNNPASVLPIDLQPNEQDVYVAPTVNAVYALAEGIHRTLQDKCGMNYNAVCASFVRDEDTYQIIMMHMDLMQFNDAHSRVFEFIEREANRALIFTRFVQSGIVAVENKEGSFNNHTITLDSPEIMKVVYQNIPATCIGACTQCDLDPTGLEEFMFIAGDIHIAGLFDIHKQGNTPYTCGEINDEHGFQLMEAFNWAMEYVNNKTGMFQRKLQGVKLGSLIFDTCSSPVRAGNLVANYHARNFEIRTTDYRIDPSLIDIYIGPMTSEASIRVADVLTELNIPQISYGASTLELRDLRKYKYFLRTVPADDKQARALISFLKKYELKNVQVISQFSTNGEYGRDEFVRLAPLNGICVTSESVIGQEGPISELEANNAITKLLNYPEARVVVVIMDDPYMLLKMANDNDNITTDRFSFIATDKWGFGIAGYENLDNLERLIRNRNVVTLDVETADFPELDYYLEDKIPATYSKNPWFKEYYEYVQKCKLLDVSANDPNTCSKYLNGYSRVEQYIQDPYALYVINAVFSTALGIHETLLQWCGTGTGQNYYGVCNILRTNGERREYFLEKIKQVTFIDQTDQPFYYTSDGESDRGFHLYEPQNTGMSLHAGATNYYWEDIGHYNDTHALKMDVTYEPNWYSSCDAKDSCMCEFPEYQPSRYLKKPSVNDLNVVFVSDIHKRDPSTALGCGAIDTGSNMQNLLAFLYAIELVNQNADSKFPGNLKLGGVALDTCSHAPRIGQDVYSLLSGEPVCGEKDGKQVVPPSSIVAFMARDSENSIAVSSMLSPQRITTISMSATSVDLSDKIEHGYFLRTVPPDNIQAIVVSQILDKFGWDYVSIVYADNTYGRSAKDKILELTSRNNPRYCFADAVALPLGATLADANDVIDKLSQKIGANVVVVFVTTDQVRLLMQATHEKGLDRRFIWIGSDTWADNTALTDGYEETAAGALTIQIRSEVSSGFRKFVESISFTDRKGIPDDWFDELYQTIFQCRILSSPVRKTFTNICSGNESFKDYKVAEDPYVLHTIISVYQIAHGLSLIDSCKAVGLTISSCLSLEPNRRQLIYDGILTAQHEVLPDDLVERSFDFKFTADGYGDVGYNIFNFKRNLTSGQFEYIKIGSSAAELTLDLQEYQGYSPTVRTLPTSRCTIGTTCQCKDRSGVDFPFSRSGYVVTAESQYQDPTTGQLVTIEDTPESVDRFRDIWAIIVATLAAIGAFAALCMFVYLLVVYPVRGGTTILGYMLCFGIILEYVLVFAFIVHPTESICGLRRFCLGFVYSICYSALFVKLVDCWRTKDKEDIYMVKYNKIGNPWGLFFSAVLLVLVQCMINAEWLILESPEVMRVIYNKMLWPRCVPDDFYDEGLILSCVYIMFLIFFSVIIGLLAFGNDKNHWDCRWNVGAVVLTIPCWMVWCLVAALGEYKMRDAAVAIGLLYNATIMLLCGPLRKLYLLNKYQAHLDEEERKSQMGASSNRDYNSMYGRQYDNAPHLQDNGSVRDSSTMGNDDVFMYEPKS